MKTLIDCLIKNSTDTPDKIMYSFYHSKSNTDSISAVDLEKRVRSIAACLKSTIKPGERVLLIYNPGIDFICALYACFYSGIIAVPSYPPTNSFLVEKLNKIINDCKPVAILTSSKFNQKLIIELGLEIITTDNIEEINDNIEIVYSQDVAFLQYTSGSTGDPKGVIVTHKNMLTNCEVIKQSFNSTKNSHGVIWLPPFHDMGLIGGILHPCYVGISVKYFSPLTFIQNPLLWLTTISESKTDVISGAPNFAYQYCNDKISNEQLAMLDLSGWKVAFCGAEPIHSRCLEDFYEKFSVCGFDKNAFLPCYGMAESTLMMTGNKQGQGLHSLSVNKEALSHRHIVIDDTGASASVVNCGIPWEEIQIVDPTTSEKCHQDHIGEIWGAGPSIAAGYWGKVDLTDKTFHAKIKNDNSNKSYLRTGDLGFIHNGELYVTGRIKEMIILQGKNYYPYDIERSIMKAHPAIKQDGCAVVSKQTEISNLLVVIVEVKRNLSSEEYNAITSAINETVLAQEQLIVDEIYLLEPHKLPKTTSGKIRRTLCLELISQGQIPFIMHWKRNTELQEPKTSIAKLINIENLRSESVAQQKITLEKLLMDNFIVIVGDAYKDKINNESNFFELGINSLLLTNYATLLNDQFSDFDIEIPVEQIFSNPSFASLVEYIQALINSPDSPRLYSEFTTSTFKIDQKFPLSYSQLIYWLDPVHVGVRTVSANIAIRGKLNIDKLEGAINTILDRHDAFWLSISNISPTQILKERTPFKLEIHEKSNYTNAFLKTFFLKLMPTGTNWKKTPLFSMHIFVKNDTEYQVEFFIPHIIADGNCAEIIAKELQFILSDHENNLPKIEASFLDYINWERQIYDPTFDSHYKFWQEYIKNDSITKMPMKYICQDENQLQHNLHTFPLNEELDNKFKKLCQENRITMAQGYMLAVSMALYELTQQNEVYMSQLAAGRFDSRLANIIGNFIDINVFNIILDKNKDFSFHAQQIKETSLYLAKFQKCCMYIKLYPLVKQNWSLETPRKYLTKVLHPFVRTYFKRYQIHPVMQQLLSEFVAADIFGKIEELVKKIFSVKPAAYQKLMPEINVLSSYYYPIENKIGNLEIIEHSYLETMNVDIGKDTMYLYLGRDHTHKLCFSIAGPLTFEAQEHLAQRLNIVLAKLIEAPEQHLGNIL
jgi:acyl-CoA synthetase (AMP-forming)/AMP-acid ligase II